MPEPLEKLADLASAEPFFLANVLSAYARAERLDVAGLAAALGCAAEDLPKIQLCRAPRGDAEGFREDVDCVSRRFQLDPARLAAVVKRGRVVARMQASHEAADEPGYLMAARDREDSPGGDA